MTRFGKLFCVLGASAALSSCYYEPAPAYYAPGPYGPVPDGPGYYGGAAAYDDPCLTDPSFCGYAYYDGPVYWGGTWYTGPHRWRETTDGREYWLHGDWRYGVRIGEGGHWRGPGRWHPD